MCQIDASTRGTCEGAAFAGRVHLISLLLVLNAAV